MTLRTIFIDTSLSDTQSLASLYDSTLYQVVMLNDPAHDYQQIQNYLSANSVTAADINIVAASGSVTGIFTPRVVFIDPSVANYQQLIADMPANATVVVLDASKDGVLQIQYFLNHNIGPVGAVDIISNIASLDVVSHGIDGEITLGTSVLNSATLTAYTAALADIGSHLTTGGDILLYGCDVAAGTTGQQFITDLAKLTGADVAASTDLTGSAALGGDWVLEASTGTIETAAIGDPAYAGVLATNALVLTSISDDVGTVQGTLVTGATTDDTNLAVKVTFPTTGNPKPKAGDFVQLYNGTTELGSSYQITDADIANKYANVQTVTLQDATYVLGAKWIIGSGSSASSSPLTNTTFSITVDTTPPADATIAMVATDDIINANERTAGVTVSGTNEDGSTVKLNGNAVVADTTTTWHYNLNAAAINAFGQGAETLTAISTDAAGNTSTATHDISVDTVAPDAPTVALLTDSGNNTDKITNVGTLNVTGTETGAVVEYSANGSTDWSASAPALTQGDNTVFVRETDVAGNISANTSFKFFYDSTVATPSAPDLTDASDSGTSHTDNITNVTTPSFSGSGAEAGAAVKLYEGATALGTGTADSSGNWTITSSALLSGDHTLTAKQTDIAGNISAASTGLSITVDTSPPTIASLVLHEDTGRSTTDRITNNGQVDVALATGTDHWQYSMDNGGPWTDATGAYFTLPEGSYSANYVQVKEFDLAGNSSIGKMALATTVDTTAPAITPIVLATVENDDILVPLLTDYTNDPTVVLNSVGPVTYSWSQPDPLKGYTLIDPVTKAAYTGGAALNNLLTANSFPLSVDQQSVLISLDDRLNWMTSGQKIIAHVGYVVEDVAGNKSIGATIDLAVFGFTTDSGKSLVGTNGADTLTGTTGLDVLQGGNGADTLSGDAPIAKNATATASGPTDTDILYGGNGNDTINGGMGNDYLFGDGGNDVIHGGAGDDVIFGGRNNDTLYGDAGKDHFVFQPKFGNDKVMDFLVGVDTLHFLGLNPTGLSGVAFATKYAVDTGTDVVITMDDGTITLVGVGTNYDVNAFGNSISFVTPV